MKRKDLELVTRAIEAAGKADAAEAIRILESALARKAEAIPRIKDLLKSQVHSWLALRELEAGIRTSPDLMEALALRYLEIGLLDDVLRALTLLHMISREIVVPRYSEAWWRRQLHVVRCWDQCVESLQISSGADNIRIRIRQWEILGVLERSPVKKELLAIRGKHAE